MRLRPPLISLFLLFTGLCQASSATLTADEAKNHIGENATVCGIVASTHYDSESRRTPTFVNLEKPYPRQEFTVVIWGEDLAKFSPKPNTWEGKRVCATGTISSYQGKPQMVAKEPGQITVH